MRWTITRILRLLSPKSLNRTREFAPLAKGCSLRILSYPFEQRVQFGAGRVVGHLHEKFLPSLRTQRQVLDRCVDHRIVWDRDQRIVGRANPRAAETYILDRAGIACDADQMADPEGSEITRALLKAMAPTEPRPLRTVYDASGKGGRTPRSW